MGGTIASRRIQEVNFEREQLVEITGADGKGFTGLEPVMAAFAHIVGFNEDYNTVLHMHPKGAPILDGAARGGPELEFQIYALRPGFVRLFAQVQIAGQTGIRSIWHHGPAVKCLASGWDLEARKSKHSNRRGPAAICWTTLLFAMELDLEGKHAARAYAVLVALVTPRPIAWVTTIDSAGVVNAAPFSFFNVLGSRPPIVGVCPEDRERVTSGSRTSSSSISSMRNSRTP